MTAQLILLGLLAAALVALLVWVLLRLRVTPADRERRRRLYVYSAGRMGDGILTDVEDKTLYYSYTVRGVDYNASQEVDSLAEHLPEGLESLVGAVTVKYYPANPANSIVVCEKWSGLRVPAPEHTATP
jgi:hypothetical protein